MWASGRTIPEDAPRPSSLVAATTTIQKRDTRDTITAQYNYAHNATTVSARLRSLIIALRCAIPIVCTLKKHYDKATMYVLAIINNQ